VAWPRRRASMTNRRPADSHRFVQWSSCPDSRQWIICEAMFPYSEARTRILMLVAIIVVLSAAVSFPAFAASSETESGITAGSTAGLVVAFSVLVLFLLLRGWRERRGLIVALTALGAGAGFGIGLSMEPVIGSVVPLLVALLGIGLMSLARVSASTRGAWVRGAAGFSLLLQLTAWLGCCLRLQHVWYRDFPTLAAIGLLFVGILIVAWTARFYWTRSTTASNGKDATIEDRTWLLVAAAAAGAFAGLATSMSKAPVVEYVVPALLSMFGLLSVFLFTEGKAVRLWLGSALVGFGLLLVLGQFLGESLRLGYSWKDAGQAAFSFSVVYVMIGGAAALLGGVVEDRVNSVGFAAMGAGVGLAVGFSASPPMSAIVPAILTAAGGVAAYFGVAREKGHRPLYVFAGVFALLLLLGAYAGFTMHGAHELILFKQAGALTEELRKEILSVRRDVSALEAAARAAGTAALPSSSLHSIDARLAGMLTTLGGASVPPRESERVDEARAYTYFWFEGTSVARAVAVTCRRTLTVPLRVDELVDDVSLFSGAMTAGVGVCLFGEAFEISWGHVDGQDAVTVLVWDRMVRVAGAWRVEGKGSPVDAAAAEIRGDRYVLTIL